MTKPAIMHSSSSTMSSPQCCLQVWVVGNPTSGGKRGAAVLDRIETLFSQTFGRYAVHTTSSSSFLHTFSPHPLMHESSPQRTGSKVTQQPSSAAPHSTPATCPWTATAIGLPAHPAGCSSSSVDCISGGVALQMVIIRTDEGGHAKAVSCALSRIIQRSRLEDGRRELQTHSLPAVPSDPAATRVAERNGDMRMSLPRPRPLPTATTTSSSSSSSTATQPFSHHVLLVVGGDGTLSEVTNGLCEGTLSGFEELMLSGGHRAETSANALHSHVEREAAVLSSLLPALVYVPGGTGSDFGKLRLCCSTPEEALRLVRDGLIPQLFPLTNPINSISSTNNNSSSSDNSRVQHRKRGWRYRFSRASPAPPSLPSPPASAVCVAHAVDIGRIEFLRTGTRHFFINECSVGMSCDVIQRVERFKRNRWISRLGGLVLFAMASFFSLLRMTPKPLYICKLPSRVPFFTSSATWMDDSEKSGGISDIATKYPQRSRKCDGDYNDCSVSMGYCDPERKSTSENSIPDTDTDTASRSKGSQSLLSVASFACLRDQLDRLSAQLWRSVRVGSTTSPSGHQPPEPLHTTPSCYTPTAGTAVPCTGGEKTYITQGHTLLPPPDAHMIRCARQTPSGHYLRLLDITAEELQTHHMQQKQQQSSAAEIACSKKIGKELIDSGVVAGMPVGYEEYHGHTRRAMSTQMMNSGPMDSHDSQVRSENFSSDSTSLNIAPSATAKTHDSVDDYMQSCSGNSDNPSLLIWVEMPSSMFAFANGRWYGGGMLVAPHANPTDGLISCTNWVATMLPFVLSAPSLYTGRHVGWKSTSAFDGHRFLISNVPSLPSAEGTKASLLSAADAPIDAREAMFMEADGEVLEAAPAIVELCGTINFLVPSTAVLRVGSPAPGTTRERFTASQQWE